MMTLKQFSQRVDAVSRSEDEGFNKFMQAVEKSPLARLGGSVIIYIEDDPDHVSFFKTMVAKYSTLNVIPAMTIEDGKRLLLRKNGRTKCVVLDVGFESGSEEGIDMLAWLKDNYPSTPVIVLTSRTQSASFIREHYPEIEVHIKATEDCEQLVRCIEAAAGV